MRQDANTETGLVAYSGVGTEEDARRASQEKGAKVAREFGTAVHRTGSGVAVDKSQNFRPNVRHQPLRPHPLLHRLEYRTRHNFLRYATVYGYLLRSLSLRVQFAISYRTPEYSNLFHLAAESASNTSSSRRERTSSPTITR